MQNTDFFKFTDVVRMLQNYPELDLSVFGLENVKSDAIYDIGDELSRTYNGKYLVSEECVHAPKDFS